jgi:hypothetical protein
MILSEYLNLLQSIQSNLKSIQIFTILIDIVTFIKYNNRIGQLYFRLLPEVFINNIIVGNNCNVAVGKLSLHHIIWTNMVQFS